VCTSFCTTVSDCGAPIAKCGTINFTLPKGGSKAFKMCTP
jgi:hypothetical protein